MAPWLPSLWEVMMSKVISFSAQRALNAAILALQIMATADDGLKQKMIDYKESLKQKIVKANQDLAEVKYKFKV